MSLLWINGELIDKAAARVSPFDHGFLYGDGVWEPFRIAGGKLVRAADHLDELFAAAAALAIDIPLSPEELLAAIEAAIRANNRVEGYLRVIITRGPGTLGPDPRKLDPQVIIIAEEYQPYPRELYDHGLHAIVAPVRVDRDNPCDRYRVLGNPKIVLAKRAALDAGCLEAIFLDRDDCVSGATEGDVFCVRDGAVVGPAAKWIGELGTSFESRPAKLEELLAADEAFLAGTACDIIAIVKVDGHTIGSGTEGPITRRLRTIFHNR
ncbi:MAG TPA: aminotransferase class IV [Urbifossiella sp.]|nr:aminotransferase class IV [Urbifossiella sp.]